LIDSFPLTAGGRLSIRPAGIRDRPFALGLYLATTEQVLRGTSGWDEGYTRARFRAVYRRKESWVLYDRAEDVGWLQLRPGQRRVILHQIHLLPSHRNRGLGTALLQELQEQAARRSKPVELWVLRPNPAVSLYRRLGFLIIGEDVRRLRMLWRPATGAGAQD
jgi:ribosomal protein S18 acetylase RimI-like enzyme